MKRLTKYFITCISAALLILATAFNAFAAEKTENQLYAESYVPQLIETLYDISIDELDSYVAAYEAYGLTDVSTGLAQWKEVMESAGELKEINDADLSISEDGNYTFTAKLVFENAKYSLKEVEDDAGIIALSFDKDPTIGEKMKEAAGNLVVGMGTVFLVLIFLCGVIYLFKYIGKAEKAAADKKAAKNAKPEAPSSISDAVQVSPVPASDDELQAVIAAAIAAYEADNGTGIQKQPSLTNGINIKTYRR